jgi:hypothetical protein
VLLCVSAAAKRSIEPALVSGGRSCSDNTVSKREPSVSKRSVRVPSTWI